MSKLAPIKIEAIHRDTRKQARAGMNAEYVAELATLVEDGAKLPPITVYAAQAGGPYHLADGWHRVAAYEKLGYKDIEAEVLKGTGREAFIFGLGANFEHGLRRTNDDKRRAVMLALADAELNAQGDRQIAQVCKVSESLVRTLRAKQVAAASVEDKPTIAAAIKTDTATRKEAARVEEYDDEPEAEEPKRRKDETGYFIPDDILTTWDDATELSRSMLANARDLLMIIEKGLTKDAIFAELTNSTLASANALVTDLKAIKPYAVCTECSGGAKRKTCKLCKSRGFISKISYQQHVSEESKQARKDAHGA